jgi:cell division protein FtsB
MAAEVFAGLGAIKTAFDMAKGLHSIHDVAARDRAVIDLQKEILAAQQAQSELIARVSELEKEVSHLKNWEADKARYELAEIAPGIVAFAVKEGLRNGEPFHRICATCCAAGKKSCLQQHIRGPYYDMFKCHGCGEELAINKGDPPQNYASYDDA